MSNKRNKSPIFPMLESQHFSDYGFDPQIHYFQVLEEAKKHKSSSSSSIDTFQFKLQKPISRDDMIRTTLHNKNKNKNKNKKRWLWCKNALFFFLKRRSRCSGGGDDNEFDDRSSSTSSDVHIARARNFRAGSISGPVYVTESWSGSSTPYRPMMTTTSAVQYLSLRELNMERQQRITTSSSSSSMSGPIYLVT
ncbi:hypothetical protein CARUB_v10028161mg [Capsella rubella]|uniref:Uncharacterized protein n=1 Tax=Capsella rubella TaxID=81985 RepID=R0F0Q4_9BRAS|nr:uncharacterized protein LOC17876981 [Capsella rubella]EOA14846.1 hypothetical protein CARUB_v10028161mg [Capsella rubella]